MGIGNHLKARQRDLEMGSSELTNRPFITFQRAAFAVLILCGAVGTSYQNASAVTGLGAAAGFSSPWKTAESAGVNRGEGPDILPGNSAGRQTIARHMNGMLRPDTAGPGILPPSWNIMDLGDFDRDGSRDILRMNCPVGKITVLNAPILAPRDLDPIAVRAPPRVAVKCGHPSGEAPPCIHGGRSSTYSFTCPLFPRGARCRLLFSSLYIRAPPVPVPGSTFRQNATGSSYDQRNNRFGVR